MYCRNCGKENREDAVFCACCGKKLIEIMSEAESEAEAGQCTAENEVEAGRRIAENEVYKTDFEKTRDVPAIPADMMHGDMVQEELPADAGLHKKSRIIPVMIAAAAVLIAAVVGGVALTGMTDTGYEVVLENVKTGLEGNDFSLIMGSFPDEYFDSISAFWSYLGADEEDTEEMYAQLYEGAASMLGYTCEITDSTVQKCDADDMEDVTDAIQNSYYVDVEIERLWKAKLDCVLTLSGTELSRTITLYLGKVDGEWYLVYSEGLFD